MSQLVDKSLNLGLMDIIFDVNDAKVSRLTTIAKNQAEGRRGTFNRPSENEITKFEVSLDHSAADLNARLSRMRSEYTNLVGEQVKYVEPYLPHLALSQEKQVTSPQLNNEEMKIIDESCRTADLHLIGEANRRVRPPADARETIIALQHESVRASEKLGDAMVMVELAKIAHEFATGNPKECDALSTMRVASMTVRVMLEQMMNQDATEHIPYTEYAHNWIEELQMQAKLEREVNAETPGKNETLFQIGDELTESMFYLQTHVTDPQLLTPSVEFGFVQLEAVRDLQQELATIAEISRTDPPNAARILKRAYNMHKVIAKWHDVRQLGYTKQSG